MDQILLDAHLNPVLPLAAKVGIIGIIGIKEIVVFTQREHGMHAQPAGFMHTKLSLTLTLAYAKLGHSYYKNNFSMYVTIEQSQLMLSLNVVIRAG